MRYIFLTYSLLGFFSLYSQTGNYFLSNISLTEERFDNVCFDIAQNKNGLIYFATRSGVLEFDGRNWNLISGNGAIYSLQIGTEGGVYWSGAGGYGTIEPDDQGFQQIKTFSAKGVKDVFQSLVVGEKIYFLNDESLFISTEDQKQVTTLNSSNLTGSFNGIVEIFGSVYLNTQRGGVFKIQNDKLVQASLGFSQDDEILFTTPYQNNYLIGLTNNKVFLCNENLKPQEVLLEDQQYVEASVIVSGRWVNRELFVLGTLRGGMIFVDAASGKTQEIINYATGLPDNEVYALMNDKSQSIWAAHQYGFTRVSPYLPFRSFSHYDGLQGNLLCALSFQDQVYVGTSVGLFKLEKEEIYDEISYYVNVEIKQNKKETAQKKQRLIGKKTDGAKPVQPEVESKKRGFLRFLKKNRNKGTSASPVDEPVRKPTFVRIKKTDSVFHNAHYNYKKVIGIDAKITELLEADGHLIAVGLGGAYDVLGLTARPILEEPAREVFAANDQKMLFISTYKNEMRTFERIENGWTSNNLLNNLDDHISFIFQGAGKEFWFCGMDKVYRLEISNHQLNNLQTIPFSNPNFDEVVGIRWKDKIMLINSQGFFQFDRIRNSFSRIDSLGAPSHYFAGDDNIWFRDLHNWNLFGQKRGQNNLHLLNLFRDLRFITPDRNSDNVWLINGNNELYKFFGKKFTPYEIGYPIILKSIRNANQKVSRRGTLQFDQEKSSVTFEVVQPDYLASQSIEYRYQLMGLEKSWSEWSSSYNIVDFPYLPSGDYSLMVQAKDIFGNIKDLQPVLFEVLPPYWKRPWFYALEFILFASLVLLSFRLSTRYRVISRLLSLLTIILLIQFIQTVIGETFETRASPVMDFFMQVLVALLILPVEGYLRNLLLRSVDPKSVLHRFIASEENPIGKEKQLEN